MYLQKLGGKIYSLSKSPRTNHHFILINSNNENINTFIHTKYPIVFYDWIIDCIIQQNIVDYYYYLYKKIDIFKGIKYVCRENNNNVESSSDCEFTDNERKEKRNKKIIMSIYYNNYRYKIGDSIQIKYNNSNETWVYINEIKISKNHMKINGLIYERINDSPPTLKLTSKSVTFNEEDVFIYLYFIQIIEMIYVLNSEDYEMKSYTNCNNIFVISAQFSVQFFFL